MEQQMQDLVEGHPGFAFIKNLIEDSIQRNIELCRDPIQELRMRFSAIVEALVRLEHLIDPMSVGPEVTRDGTMTTMQHRNKALIVTDIKGFTPMTQEATKRGLSILDILKHTYFPHIMHLLDKYQVRYANYTGDGVIGFCGDRVNAWGKVELPAQDNMTLAAIDLIGVSDSIGVTWKTNPNKQMRFALPDGSIHETGSGISYGDFETGDPLVLPKDIPEMYASFNERFREVIMERSPHFEPRLSHTSGIRSCNAAGVPLNECSRLQNLDREYEDHSCIMPSYLYDMLSTDALRKRMEFLGKESLKGFGTKRTKIGVYGFPRENATKIPELYEECLKEFASRPYSRSANKSPAGKTTLKRRRDSGRTAPQSFASGT